MNASDILETLREFPPSMRVIVKAKSRQLGQMEVEKTVIELTLELMQRPPETSVSFFGLGSFILREHRPAPTPNAPPQLAWLTMDWR